MFEFFNRRERVARYLLLTDYLILVGSFILAMRLRGLGRGWGDLDPVIIAVLPETAMVMLYGLLALVLFNSVGLYLRKTWMARALHGVAILQGVTITILGYILLRSLTKSFFITESRLVWFYWTALLLFGLLLHRTVVFPFIVRKASQSGLQRRIALIGDTPLGRDFLNGWKSAPEATTMKLVGLISDTDKPVLIQDLPYLGRLDRLADLTGSHRIEGAVIANPDLSHEALINLIEECVRLFGWVDVHSEKSRVWEKGPATDFHFDIPFVRVRSIPHSPLYRGYKRTLDILASGLGLLAVSPLLLTVMALVKATSPGPVFHIRPRIGIGGKSFLFYKIRSMQTEAELDPRRREAVLEHMKSPDAVSGKIVNPDLVTPIGRFIRKWAIDELPQLWNVLRGDMSLVGPRPLPPEEYEAQAAWHKRRFEIQPGCTGLWKLYSGSGSTFADTVLYDLYYARNMNPLMDMHILIRTVWLIVKGRADT